MKNVNILNLFSAPSVGRKVFSIARASKHINIFQEMNKSELF